MQGSGIFVIVAEGEPVEDNIIQAVELPVTPVPIVSIGAGGIVEASHYPAYRKAGFTVTGLYDANPSRAAIMADKFKVPAVYSSLADAVSQAPANAIFDLAVPATAILSILPQLPDGRGVLIQKPMGETLEEARQIRALCHAKHLTAAINFQLR